MLDEKMRLRTRNLKVEGMTCSGCEQKVEEALKELKGVRSVNADYETGKLRLEYDVMEITLKDIEPKIEDLGYHLPSGFFSKIKRGFIHDADTTARENYSANMSKGCKLDCCTLNQDQKLKSYRNQR
tara:strand:+ start:202 stop:582 length:381 start_codon:yes stop_codon:yes gene_type:complete